MSDLDTLRERSRALFTRLLAPGRAPAVHLESTGAEESLALAAPRVPFSVFDEEQLGEAMALAGELTFLADAGADALQGLTQALDRVESRASVQSDELRHHALALFVTHHGRGRTLAKPRPVFANPERFAATPSDLEGAFTGLDDEGPGASGPERAMDYWREDRLANEHHQHWHEVYPAAGLPPSDWAVWSVQVDDAVLAQMFELADALTVRPAGPAGPAVGPAPQAIPDGAATWAAWLGGRAGAERVAALSDRLQALQTGLDALPAGHPARRGGAFRAWQNAMTDAQFQQVQTLNDRHGELFIYMHQQMLARYDAERMANGLARVQGWADPTEPIDVGYDPGNLAIDPADPTNTWGARPPNQEFGAEDARQLRLWRRELEDAVQAGVFQGPSGQPNAAVSAENLGRNVEGVSRRLRPELNPGLYGNYHNMGHNYAGQLSQGGPGVMLSTATAIRDPFFWRWHKNVDNLGHERQQRQRTQSFADAPTVGLQKGPSVWTGTALILCRTEDLPGSDADDFLELGGPALAEDLFGGADWDTDFTRGTATTGDGVDVQTRDELETWMTTELDGTRWLNHRPFSWFLRLANPTDADAVLTVRAFLVPASEEEDRRAWIELDKIMTRVPAQSRRVLFRADQQSTVVKKPVDRSPIEDTSGHGTGPEQEQSAYCDCGWPYTLLLPRGTPAGVTYRLAVVVTDAAIDGTARARSCGSMSFCGARDEYPDKRAMGYPFDRRFEGDIPAVLQGLPSATARSFVIRDVDPPPTPVT